MNRYTRANRADWFNNDNPLIPSLTADEHKPVETGLLYPDGSPIMRLPNPIGFGRHREW